ncbi:MAG: inorganic phosphate transporter [Candidatus Limnocylindrales bacterium]
MDLPLLLAAMCFAVITGANDGASLIALNLDGKALAPLTALALLVFAVVVGPFLLGTAVATTYARGLVAFGGEGGSSALLCAVIAAIGVVFVMSRLELPTSVTQALTGAIVGAGIGRDLPVDWSTVARVLIILVVAPIVSGGLAYGIALLLAHAPPRSGLATHLRPVHAVSFLLQCTAYAANDAQKMTAIMAVALGMVTTQVVPVIGAQALIGLLFLGGSLFGVRGLASRLGLRLMPVRPLNAITAGFASATAVLASASVGAPVSMAQANAAGLVGSELVLEGYRRVRWAQAARIGLAWITTLPAAVVAAAVLGAATLGRP